MKLLPYYEEPLTLPALGKRPKGAHVFDRPSVDAVNAALAAERPLLVRGEPGTGKSQLARAAAAGLGRAFCASVIDARTESRDLKWTLDAVARLADAQVQRRRRSSGRLKLDPYLAPGPLWWAFDWQSAAKQARKAEVEVPPAPADWQPSNGVVLLLDEIDKAEVSVPNGLLEALGQGRFTIPGGQEICGTSSEAPPPLVVVTTNEERALPDAFLRRCLVLPLALPTETDELKMRLVEWGEAHFPDCDGSILLLAATMLAEDRPKRIQRGLAAPGGAEYVDLLRSAIRLASNPETPELEISDPVERIKALLKRNRNFVYDKHPGEGYR